ncbi:SRPBCC family protein [Paucihalobacter sp.]|uniref:SRPBCC family protein n=1 Tax=Paucihalobacter sp. TaxID=2850405 RepID=UPI002FE403C3
MNYSTEILIDLPRAEVLKMLTSVDNLKHWQTGFISAEHLSGELGKFGAKMKLQYKFGSRTMVMLETITKKDLPFEIHYSYSTVGMHNVQRNIFQENARGVTKWISKNEFIPTSFKMRFFLWLMPNIFKKQSLKYMIDFKNFAEQNISLANA